MPWIREQTSMDFAWRWLCVGLAGLLVLTGSARGDDSGPRPLDISFIPSLDFPDGPKAGDPLAIAYREASKGKRTALKPGDSIAFRGSLTSLVVASGGKVMQVAAPAAGPGQTERQPIFPFPIQKTTLDNGLAVISVPFDSPGIIAYYTVVRAGSRNEVEKGLSGFAHFFEHMMFRGTEKYPQKRYNDV